MFLVIFNAYFVKSHISKTKKSCINYKVLLEYVFGVSALLFITGRLYSLLPVFVSFIEHREENLYFFPESIDESDGSASEKGL